MPLMAAASLITNNYFIINAAHLDGRSSVTGGWYTRNTFLLHVLLYQISSF